MRNENFIFYVHLFIDSIEDYIRDELLDKEWKRYTETTTLRNKLEEFRHSIIEHVRK